LFFYAAMQVISVRDPAFFSLKMTCQLKSRRSQDGSRDFVDFRSQPAGYPAITREVWRSQRDRPTGSRPHEEKGRIRRNDYVDQKPCD